MDGCILQGLMSFAHTIYSSVGVHPSAPPVLGLVGQEHGGRGRAGARRLRHRGEGVGVEDSDVQEASRWNCHPYHASPLRGAPQKPTLRQGFRSQWLICKGVPGSWEGSEEQWGGKEPIQVHHRGHSGGAAQPHSCWGARGDSEHPSSPTKGQGGRESHPASPIGQGCSGMPLIWHTHLTP